MYEAPGLWQLPVCAQLQELHLHDSVLQLVPTDNQKGLLHNMQRLTLLEVSYCEVDDSGMNWYDSSPAFADLPDLQHLLVRGEHDECDINPCLWLSSVTTLTALELMIEPPVYEATEMPLHHITDMSNLQQLTLGMGETFSTEAVTGLQQLTMLDLSANPGWSRGLDVEPAVLACCSQLQHLRLSEVHCDAISAAGFAALMSHIGAMQDLTHLSLTHGSVRDNRSEALAQLVIADVPAATYSALTGSSKLQHLDLRNWPWPRHAWEHVFPAGRRLPNLRNLTYVTRYGHAPPMSDRDLACMAACCPQLQQLELGAAYDIGNQSGDAAAEPVALHPLTTLSQLTRLELLTSKNGLEQLTQLQVLHVDSISAVDVLHLSALQNLTSLEAGDASTAARCGRWLVLKVCLCCYKGTVCATLRQCIKHCICTCFALRWAVLAALSRKIA